MAAPIPDEQAALLAAIVAEPDDDTARLVYADWLEENGDEEQATFIRESIAAARASSAGTQKPRSPKWDTGKAWLKALGLNRAGAHRFERGFPAPVIYWSPADFFKEMAALFTLLPVGDVAIFWQYGQGLDLEALEQLAATPELARLHTLRLANYDTEIPLLGWNELLRSPYIRKLRRLSVGAAGLTDDHARALAACPNLPELVGLDLSENAITATGALALVHSPHLQSVEHLSLMANDLESSPLYGALVEAVTRRFGSELPLHDLPEALRD